MSPKCEHRENYFPGTGLPAVLSANKLAKIVYSCEWVG